MAYGFLAPAALLLACDEWNGRRQLIALLLSLYALAHLVALISVVVNLYDLGYVLDSYVRLWLTPIVVLQMVAYGWLTISRMREGKIP